MTAEVQALQATNRQTAILQSMLEEIGFIREQLGSESRSSVEISTSTRGNDIKVKVYPGSPVRGAADEAIDEYLRVRAELERRLMGGA